MNFLNWYKEQSRRHGAAKAVKLFAKVYGSRLKSEFANKLLSPKVECPVCGWRGHKFYDYIDGESFSFGVECPQCLSHGRHRALYRWLKNDFRLAEKSGLALVCAPEKPIVPLWDSSDLLKVAKLDIEPSRGVDVLADLQEIPFADNAYDIIWCHHVLEQIPDDGKALREMFRVLKPKDGTLIVSSAMAVDETTNEFGRANINHFGNWRIYGQDFPNKLADCGFTVETVEYNLEKQDYKKFGIDAQEKVYLCRKAV
ncbi:MAG: class I SAM-dependent methyltransferase [Actinomycetota bacterium]